MTKNTSFFSKIIGQEKRLQFDLGASANLLVSDLSEPVLGLGMGHHYSLIMNFATEKKKGLKFFLTSVKAAENNFRNTRVAADTYLRRLEQKWFQIGFGIENRKQNRLVKWYWDWALGYAFGADSRLQTQGSDISDALVNTDSKTNSYLYLSLGAGVRKDLNKKWTLNGSFRTYSLLTSLYTGDYSSKTLILLPLMASVGLEYSF